MMTIIPVSMPAMAPKHVVAIPAKAAMARRNMKRWKKDMKTLRGVRRMRRPDATMPVTWMAKIAVKILGIAPVAEESLLGRLRAEKSIIVVPSWRVEFVLGMSGMASAARFS